VRCILCAAALIAAAQLPASAPKQIRVAVNMATIESAPVFVADRDATNVRMELRSGGIPLLLDGSVDAATNSETQALLRSVDRPDLRIVMTVAECAYRVVARKASGIATPADLRGKKIGTPANTSAHFYLVKLLRSVGLGPSDVTVVPMPVADMAAAIGRADVDAVSGWEPGAHDAIATLGAGGVTFQPRRLYRELFDLNTTTAVLNDPGRRAALVAAVRAMVTASEAIRRKPPESWPLVSSRINVPTATISDVWTHFQFSASLPGDIIDVLVEQEQWVAAVQNRSARTRAQLATLVDDTVLREARNGRAGRN
jgi:NitT/TauT family transport system substrate-binding protein